MSSNSKVKGFIFKCRQHGRYYLEPNKGEVVNKVFAYVYTAEEARAYALTCPGWGGSEEGKWIVVYE